MPTKDKKRGTWTGRIQKVEFPFKKKRGFKTKAEASKWERETLERLKNPPKVHEYYVYCANEYLSWCKKRREKNTVRQKIYVIKQLLKSLNENLLINEISGAMIERHLDKLFDNSNGTTANRHLREIKTFFNWLINREYIDRNPCISIEKYKSEPFKKYVPPFEDINAVLLEAKGWEHDFLQCIYHTAARRIEIVRLTWDDINFQTNTIKLWTRKRLGGNLEFDELYMNALLKGVLQKRFAERNRNGIYVFPGNSDGMMSKNTLDKLMPKLCRNAGVKPFGFHAIRHYVASVMADSKKLSIVDVQKMLRHKRATTTDVYLNQLAESKTTAADVIAQSYENSREKIQSEDHKEGEVPTGSTAVGSSENIKPIRRPTGEK